MRVALDGFVIDGIAHNIPFLASLMAHPRWQEGALTTNFIAEEYPDGFIPAEPSQKESKTLAAIAVSIENLRQKRLGADHREDWVVKINDTYIDMSGEGGVETDYKLGSLYWRGQIGGEDIVAQIRQAKNALKLEWRGLSVTAQVMRPKIAELDKLMPEVKGLDTAKYLLCPMPGLVVSLDVEEGQSVQAGDTLAIIEAMKMENVLRAERDGIVKKVNAGPGQSLAVDEIILEFE